MERIIKSRQNSYVKYIKSLKDKRTRDTEKRLVIEGVRLVEDALLSGVLPDKIIVSEKGIGQPSVKKILGYAGDKTETVYVTDEVMNYMSHTETPQGIMAVVGMPGFALSDLDIKQESVLVVMDGIQDPGNVGTIIRTADAFGIRSVILIKGCADPYNPKTLRSTMGSVFHLTLVRGVEIPELIEFFDKKKIFKAVTSVDGDPISKGLSSQRPMALIFGSEARGVSPEILNSADAKYKIPMPGYAESLNVAVASGIILYEALCRNGF